MSPDYHLGAVIGWILVILVFPSFGHYANDVSGETMVPDSEIIDLNIGDTFDLANTSHFIFDRTFSLSQKQEINLIHLECLSTENIVDNVFVNITINGIQTSETFQDSSSDVSSPYTFHMGSTITIKIDSSIPIYVLSNTIRIEITVDTRSIFNSNLGFFIIENGSFETLTPPSITSSSVKVDLPLQISRGIWYVSPLTILRERRLRTEVFATIEEDCKTQINVRIDPNTYPLSAIDFMLTTPGSYFEYDSGSINANLVQGDTLFLDFKFRASSDLEDPIIDINLEISITVLSPVGPNPSPNTPTDLAFTSLPLAYLEGLRFIIIAFPLFLFYIRRSPVEIVEDKDIIQNRS